MDKSACKRLAACPASTSRRVSASSRINTFRLDKSSSRPLALDLPSSVNCQVFWRLSSPRIERECSLTCPLRSNDLIALLTLGGCCAHASAIPGRVKAAVTTNLSACSSSCNR